MFLFQNNNKPATYENNERDLLEKQSIIDQKNDRLLVVEGFTYAPSVNKREFLFELEAIAKSLRIN